MCRLKTLFLLKPPPFRCGLTFQYTNVTATAPPVAPHLHCPYEYEVVVYKGSLYWRDRVASSGNELVVTASCLLRCTTLDQNVCELLGYKCRLVAVLTLPPIHSHWVVPGGILLHGGSGGVNVA